MAAKTMEEIAQFLQSIRFKHKLLGGVDDDDVWRIIDKLQQEYATLLEAQAEQSKALIDERDKYIDWMESLQATGASAHA